MNKLLKSICLAICFMCTGAGAETGHGTAEEAVAMVQKTIAYMKANGREKAYAEVNNPKGQFVDRDLYVSIYDMNMKNLAHGGNPRMIGKDMSDLRDIDGKYITRELIEIAKTKGKGWQEYKYVNPVSKQIEPKAMYVERFEDLVISSGIYRNK